MTFTDLQAAFRLQFNINRPQYGVSLKEHLISERRESQLVFKIGLLPSDYLGYSYYLFFVYSRNFMCPMSANSELCVCFFMKVKLLLLMKRDFRKSLHPQYGFPVPYNNISAKK